MIEWLNNSKFNRGWANLNNRILDYIVWIPELNKSFREKWYEIYKKINFEANLDNNIESWKIIIDFVENIKGWNLDKLWYIAWIMHYIERLKDKKFFKGKLKITLIHSIYSIEWFDDIFHIITSAFLTQKLGEHITLKIWQWKEEYFSKAAFYKSKIRINSSKERVYLNNNIIGNKALIVVDESINDSIQDMKSNIIWVLLSKYLEANKEKNIYDFFVSLKTNNALQNEFKKLEKEYGLSTKDFKSNGVIENDLEQYPLNYMF